MDFREEIERFPVKLRSKNPQNGEVESLDLTAARSYLRDNPDLFYQQKFSDGTLTNVSINPTYRAFESLGKTPPPEIPQYSILSSYSRDGGNIDPAAEYSFAVARGTMNSLSNDSQIAFQGIELSGYQDHGILTFVRSPHDYHVFSTIPRNFQLIVDNADGIPPFDKITMKPRGLGDYPKFTITRDSYSPDGAPRFSATANDFPIDVNDALACISMQTHIVMDDVVNLPLPEKADCPFVPATEERKSTQRTRLK